MQEVIQNARHDAERAGHAPSDKLGQNSKPMKSLRALGRTLADINLLVFNMGRADYRNKHMLPYMMLIQTSTKPDLGHGCKTALGVVGQMFEATRSLVQMQGIVRFICNLFRGHHELLQHGRQSNVSKKSALGDDHNVVDPRVLAILPRIGVAPARNFAWRHVSGRPAG